MSNLNFAYQVLEIDSIKEETTGFKTFYFTQDSANLITYEAGQYLTLVLPDIKEEIRRSYSIVSAPVLAEPLAIGVKRIENGLVSRRLIDLVQPGDELTTIGVGGFFTLPPDLANYKQIFFLAAGSGITPIYSLIKTILYAHPAIAVILLYSNHSEKTTIYRQELQQLALKYTGRFKLEFLYSDNPDLSRARLRKDLLEWFISKYAIAPLPQLLAYVCGPLNYMRMCTYGLREVGVPAANIRKENFSTEKPPLLNLPPDQEAYQVVIRINNQVYNLQSQYPNTILQTARKAGIGLPYSCEVGRCGNCVAKCIQGKVWLSYNEVLTDKEIARGLTLTCVGYPVGGNVVLEI